MHNPKTERLMKEGMTVAQLIAELQEFDEDAIVVFSCDYGDYSHTKQALPIDRISPLEAESGETLADSAYSHSGVQICERDEPAEHYKVVVLS